jgi:hypothetical protein
LGENGDIAMNLISVVLRHVVQYTNSAIGWITSGENWMHAQLGYWGVTPRVQVVLMLAMTGAVILAIPRVLDGLMRVFVILVLVLIAAHIALPMFRA